MSAHTLRAPLLGAACVLALALPRGAQATTYYVDSKAGSDANPAGDATSDKTAWATVTRALSEETLRPGDVIQILPGTYSAVSGESFPLPLQPGVAVVGAGSEDVLISGVGVADLDALFTTVGPNDDIRVEGLAMGGAAAGITLDLEGDGAQVTLSDLLLEELGQGVTIDAGSAGLTLSLSGSRFVDLETAVAVNATGPEGLALRMDVEGNSVTGGQGVIFDGSDTEGELFLDVNTAGNLFTGVSMGIGIIALDPVADITLVGFLRGDTYDAPTGRPIAIGITGMDTGGAFALTTLLDIQGCTFNALENGGPRYLVSSGNLRSLSEILTFDQNTFTGSGAGLTYGLKTLAGAALSPQLIVTDNAFVTLDSGLDITLEDLDNDTLDGLFSVGGNTFADLTDWGVLGQVHSSAGSPSTDLTFAIQDNDFDEIGGDGVDLSLTFQEAHERLIYVADIGDNTFADIGGEEAIHLDVLEIDANEEAEISALVHGNTFEGPLGVGFLDERLAFIQGGDITLRSSIEGNTQRGGGIALAQVDFSGLEDLDASRSVLRFIDNTTEALIDGGLNFSHSVVDSVERFAVLAEVAGNTTVDGGAGAVLSLSLDHQPVLFDVDVEVDVLNNTFTNPSGLGAEVNLGGAEGIASSASTRGLIAGNWITTPGEGGLILNALNLDSEVGSAALTVGGNRVTGALGDGLRISTEGVTGARGSYIWIEDNALTDGDARGMALSQLGPIPDPFLRLSGNVVTGNGEAGVALSAPGASLNGAPWDLGGGPLSSPGNNTLMGSGDADLSVESLHDGPVYAQSNYWGTTSLVEIAGQIADGSDVLGESPPLAEVSYAAPLEGPPEGPTVDATLTVEVIDDSGLAGPSAGDIVRYTATLTGTGATGCGRAELVSPPPTGGTLVKGSAEASPGVVAFADVRGLKAYLGYLPAGRSVTVWWDVQILDGGQCAGLDAFEATARCEALGDIPVAMEPVELAQQTFGRDDDGDGYGDPRDTQRTCEDIPPPEGFVANVGDCDDGDDAISPDATEICDGVDNDCDGAIDEAGAEGAQPWPLDGDRDGYGDGAAGLSDAACAPPEGYAAVGGDCDDALAEVNPGASEICDDLDNDCDEGVDEDALVTLYTDGDGDGFGADGTGALACVGTEGLSDVAGDCDDGDDAVFPGAAETCDDEDNDCDGDVDEDAGVTGYPDRDGDGYGVTTGATIICPGETGYADEGGDCNDNSALTNPGAAEICDGRDNDCDRGIDEDLDQTFYLDADRDGHGAPSVSEVACEAPSGYVLLGDDCNDNAPNTYPGATEVCDIADNDCDTLVDEGLTSPYYADADGDGYGNGDASTEACAAPTGYVDDDTDCDDSAADISPAGEEVCDGVDNDCDDATDEGLSCDETPTEGGFDVGGAGGCSHAPQGSGGTGGLALLGLSVFFLRRRRSPFIDGAPLR